MPVKAVHCPLQTAQCSWWAPHTEGYGHVTQTSHMLRITLLSAATVTASKASRAQESIQVCRLATIALLETTKSPLQNFVYCIGDLLTCHVTALATCKRIHAVRLGHLCTQDCMPDGQVFPVCTCRQMTGDYS